MKKLISVLLAIVILPSNINALDGGKGSDDIPWSIFLIVLSGIIGYVVGAIKSFREEKQKAYGEIIPPLLKMAYNPQDSRDEKEYSKALAKLWLYGSKKVTRKMEYALELLHNPTRGDVTNALQEAIVEMRRDIQLFSWQTLKPEDVGHLYTRIVGDRHDNHKST
jgi:hypothetical protein